MSSLQWKVTLWEIDDDFYFLLELLRLSLHRLNSISSIQSCYPAKVVLSIAWILRNIKKEPLKVWWKDVGNVGVKLINFNISPVKILKISVAGLNMDLPHVWMRKKKIDSEL